MVAPVGTSQSNLTPEQRARAVALDRDIDRVSSARARRRIIPYTERMMRRYVAAAFHHRIAEFLEAILRGEIRRGAIILPPRHGKSTLASEHLPSFALGRNPDLRLIACSHTQRLADTFSRRARNKIRDPRWPWPHIGLSKDVANVREWDLSRILPAGEADWDPYRGGYIAAGVNGPITGMGANLLLIDDAVKSARDADSPVMREATWDWFTGTALTRLESDSAVVLIGTRWHFDDLIGRATRRGQYEILHLPAIDAAGNALWPEVYPVSDPSGERRSLESIRADVGERNWQAQYQGAPTADEGAILKSSWFVPYDRLPDGIRYFVQHWDTAFKDAASADYSVCTTWAVTEFGMWLVDLWRGQVTFPVLRRKAIELHEAWSARQVCIEDKVSGTSLLQVLRAETDVPVVAIEPCGNKILRAHDVTPVLESLRIHVPRWAPWRDDLMAELTAFPLGINDDQVDSVTQAIAREYPSLNGRRSGPRVSSYAESAVVTGIDPDDDAPFRDQDY